MRSEDSRPVVDRETPPAALRANEHVSASCHCHPLSIYSGLASNSKQPNPQPIERTVWKQLAMCPTPGQRCAERPHTGTVPTWLCLGYSAGKARHFSKGPATKYYKITFSGPRYRILQDYIRLSSLSLAEVFEARGTGIMTAPRGTSRHWTGHRVISRRESPFMVLAKQNILNAKTEKRTFCARLLHPQTRLMHPDRTHPSTMIQATHWNHHHYAHNWPPLLTMTSAERGLTTSCRQRNAPCRA